MHRARTTPFQVVEFTALANLQVHDAAQNAGFGAQAGCERVRVRRPRCGVVLPYPPVAYIREEVESFVLTWKLHGLRVVEGAASDSAASGVGAAVSIGVDGRRILGVRFEALVDGPAVVGPRFAAVYLLP